MDQTFRKVAGARCPTRLSVLLCLVLVLGALPGAAWAGDAGSDGCVPTVAAAGGVAAEVAPLSAMGLVGWKAVSAGNNHSLAIRDDGSLWAWGSNFFGQLGDGTTVTKHTPQSIALEKTWKVVSAGGAHSLGIKEDGTLWAWGYNNNGQLGIGTTVNKNTPVRVGSAADSWKAVSAGASYSLAIKSDGSLWAWGHNMYGQLGNGANGLYYIMSTPVQVGSATDWQAVSAGGDHSLGVKDDGSLWTWGWNSEGQLGDSTSENRDIPILAGGTVTRISGTDRFATAIEISKKSFDSAGSVIVATGMSYADALSASALAGALEAPLLLTRKDVLSPGVLDEIGRLGADEVCIIGSGAAVSKSVEHALEEAGLEVFRLEGEDRYETSAEIAWAVAMIEEIKGTGFTRKAFLARGDNFADSRMGLRHPRLRTKQRSRWFSPVQRNFPGMRQTSSSS